MTKTLFITGASSGIGQATARAAVADGWSVALMARREQPLNALRDELGAEHVEVIAGDATSLEAQQAGVAKTVARWGQLNAAFANAGIGVNTPGTENGDPEEWQKMIDINVMGVLWTAKATLSHLRETKGHFVVTGSVAGRMNPAGSIYSASKWFVNGFGSNLAGEMAKWGGRCTTISPGMVDTPFFDNPKPGKLKPEDIAASVLHALNAPRRVNVREVFIMPTEV